MPFWQWFAWVLVAFVALFLLAAIALVLRRRLISRDGGTFELSIRARTAEAGRGWVLGIGRYHGDELQWFRIFSFDPRPKRAWHRSDLVQTGRRDPGGVEQMSLYADHVIILVDSDAGPLEMAMSPSTLMGFQSWLESAPPGADWTQRPRR